MPTSVTLGKELGISTPVGEGHGFEVSARRMIGLTPGPLWVVVDRLGSTVPERSLFTILAGQGGDTTMVEIAEADMERFNVRKTRSARRLRNTIVPDNPRITYLLKKPGSWVEITVKSENPRQRKARRCRVTQD